MNDPPGRIDPLAAAAPFVAITLVAAVFGFVGLAASSYWIDELFTLFVIDHHGGLAEVWRRALTDTHPPAYYAVAYGWIGLFGSSETALRSLSAIFAVATLGVLFVGLRPVASLPARAFAVALAAGSSFWFEFAQTARSYTLCAFVSAALIALAVQARRADREARPVPTGVPAGLFVVGLLGAFSHFYSFLTVGAVYLFLLITVRRTRFRIAVVVMGVVIFVLVALYARALLGATVQDVHHMWFSNTAWALTRQGVSGLTKGLSGLAIPALLVLIWLRRRAPRADPAATDAWLPAMTGTVVAVVVVSGLAIAFTVAPSFGKRNLTVLAPFLWAGCAWLYDRAVPSLRGRAAVAAAVGLGLVCAWPLLILPTRLAPRTEDWRASAAALMATPGCETADIAVVLPYKFGPSTPFFRDLARTRFFGRYIDRFDRLRPFTPDEIAGPKALPAFDVLATAATRPGACSVMLWAVHDVTAKQARELAAALAAKPGIAGRASVRTVGFNYFKPGWLGGGNWKAGAWLFLAQPRT